MEIRKFKPLFNEIDNIDKGLYAEIDSFIHLLDGISRLTHQCSCLIDYYKKEIIYAYDNPLFVDKSIIQNFASSNIPFLTNPILGIEDETINLYIKSWFDFIDNLPIDERKSYFFQYDYYLDDKLICVSMTPSFLSYDGKPWIVLCTTTVYTSSQAGNALIMKQDPPELWTFS